MLSFGSLFIHHLKHAGGFTDPFRNLDPSEKQKHKHTDAHTLVERTRFSSCVLGLCDLRAMATEHGGEKNLCAAWPSSIPLAVMPKLCNPMTKTTFHI